MTIREITEAVGGSFTGDPALLTQAVTGVVIDSRQVSDGSLFVPIRGARVDGHDFIPQVLQAGALCTFSEEDPADTAKRFDADGDQAPVIYVSSTEEALRSLAAWYRSQLTIPVIGITGSFGKTSAKEMVASVLSARFNVLKTAGNLNNAIGLPLTICKIRPEHEVAVLEMGISEFGEMTVLAQMARPDLAIITTIGDCHLEQLVDREGVYKAKSEMFGYLHDEDSRAILRADDAILGAVETVNGHKPYFYGMEPVNPNAATETMNDAYVSDIVSRGLDGTDCVLHIADQTFPVHVPIPGLHMLYHMMAGAVAGHLLGMTPEEIAAGAAKVEQLPGHGQIICNDRYIILDDAYNANPATMKATLETLQGTDRRRVAILGDMGELGENERALHYAVGSFAGECPPDLLLTAGELAKEILRGYQDTPAGQAACEEGRALCYDSKEELMIALPSLLKDGDAILVKASHFMGFEDIVDSLNRS